MHTSHTDWIKFSDDVYYRRFSPPVLLCTDREIVLIFVDIGEQVFVYTLEPGQDERDSECVARVYVSVDVANALRAVDVLFNLPPPSTY